MGRAAISDGSCVAARVALALRSTLRFHRVGGFAVVDPPEDLRVREEQPQGVGRRRRGDPPSRGVVLEMNTRKVPINTGHEINPSDEMTVALRVAGQARGLARGVFESRVVRVDDIY